MESMKWLDTMTIGYEIGMDLVPGFGKVTVYNVEDPKILNYLSLGAQNARVLEAYICHELDLNSENVHELLRAEIEAVGRLDELEIDIGRVGFNYDPIEAVFYGENYADIAEGARRFVTLLRMREKNTLPDQVRVNIYSAVDKTEADKLIWALENRRHSSPAMRKKHTPMQKVLRLVSAIEADDELRKEYLALPESCNLTQETKELQKSFSRKLSERFPEIDERTRGQAIVWPLYRDRVIPQFEKNFKRTGCPVKTQMRKNGIDWLVKLIANSKLFGKLVCEDYISIEEIADLILGMPQEVGGKWKFNGKRVQNMDFRSDGGLLDLLVCRGALTHDGMLELVRILKDGGRKALRGHTYMQINEMAVARNGDGKRHIDTETETPDGEVELTVKEQPVSVKEQPVSVSAHNRRYPQPESEESVTEADDEANVSEILATIYGCLEEEKLNILTAVFQSLTMKYQRRFLKTIDIQ